MKSAALYLVAASMVSVSSACNRSVTCSCGDSGNIYRFCIDALPSDGDNPCNRWSRCQTCNESVLNCLTCPPGRSGELCTTAERKCEPMFPIKNGKLNRITDPLRPCELIMEDSTKSEPVGTQLQYSCDPGYSLKGAEELFCLPNGFWSSESPVCVDAERKCEPMVPIDNGKLYRILDPLRPRELIMEDSTKSEPVGTQLQYSCDPGYSLKGAEELFCLLNGFWSSEPPVCVDDFSIQCVPLEPLKNGKSYLLLDHNKTGELITVDSSDELEFPVEAKLEYTCDPGYTLQGEKNLSCLPTGFWSDEQPECLEDCGMSNVEDTSNGNYTESGKWPWMVTISEPTPDNQTSMICSGAILNKRTVVTAAHCFTNNASYYVLHFGKFHRNDLEDNTIEIRRSYEIISHPEFNQTSYANDIALVKLEFDLNYTKRISPVCLPTQKSTAVNLVEGNIGTVLSYGIAEKNQTVDHVMTAQLPVQNDSTCISSYQRLGVPLEMAAGMFCAGYHQGNNSACRRDSGSPLVFYNPTSERYTLEGCVSFSAQSDCDLPERYTMFTKISDFLPWIEYNKEE